MKYIFVISSLSLLAMKNCVCMDKPAEIMVVAAASKESVESKGKGYKISAHALLTRSTSEHIERCRDQKDVIARYKKLEAAKKDGRDKSPEFINFNLIALENGENEAGKHSSSELPTKPKMMSLSPVRKKKIAQSPLGAKVVAASLSDETSLDDEDSSLKPSEKARRNTISN